MHQFFGDYVHVPVRTAAILTTAYVAGAVIGSPASASSGIASTAPDVSNYNFLALEVDFTIGSLTDAQIKVEMSDDNVTYYQVGKGTVASGVDTVSLGVLKLTGSGKYYINVNAELFSGGGFRTKYILVSSIGTGTLTNSSLAITAVLGVA